MPMHMTKRMKNATIAAASTLALASGALAAPAQAADVTANVPLACTATASNFGGGNANTSAEVKVSMPDSVNVGENVPVSISMDPVSITDGQIGRLSSVSLKSSTLRINVGRNVELVNPPAGVGLSNGVLVVNNAFSLTKSGTTLKLSVKPVNVTLRPSSGSAVKVGPNANIVSFSGSGSVSIISANVTGNCTTGLTTWNQTTIVGGVDDPDLEEPGTPDPGTGGGGDTQNPGGSGDLTGSLDDLGGLAGGSDAGGSDAGGSSPWGIVGLIAGLGAIGGLIAWFMQQQGR